MYFNQLLITFISLGFLLADQINNNSLIITCNSSLNNINYLIESNVFADVTHLIIKNCSAANSTDFNKKQSILFTNNKLLSGLTSLEIINSDIYSTKLDLPNVKKIIFNNNNLDYIEHGTFKRIPNLQELHITSNKLDSVSNVSLCNAFGLKLLNLSKNMLINTAGFYCEKKDPSEFQINDAAYKIKSKTKLKSSGFFPVLEDIDLGYNYITSLENFFVLISLKKINLEYNQLSVLKNTDFSQFVNLEELVVRHNGLNYVETGVFNNKSVINFVDMSYNNLNFLNLTFLHDIEKLNLEHNRLNVDTLHTINVMGKLKVLILSHNNFTDLSENIFTKFPLLKILKLDNNNLTLNIGSFNGLNSLKELYLSNASLSILDSALFNDLYKLISLDVSCNKLTNLNFLNNLGGLKTLNVSKNDIETLEDKVFENLVQLETLDLTYNKIKFDDLEFLLTNIPKSVKIVKIKSNQISCRVLLKILFLSKEKGYNSDIDQYLKIKNGRNYCVEDMGQGNALMIVTILLSISIVTMLFINGYVYFIKKKISSEGYELV